jgi:hypothetical protein
MPIIEQAIDVKPLLGDRFYFDLINNLDKKISTIIRWLCILYFGIIYTMVLKHF